MIKIYNSLSNQKEEFKPIVENEVKMYACGPTVYNYFHIGNARPIIVFDVLRRYFEYRGYKVTFVQNFTDIDDKMINRANEEGITVKELADKFIAEYFKDAQGLGVRGATIHPKATENIDVIIDTVDKLIENGHAYAVGGNVYFRTKSFPEYGKLSHQPLEDLEAGARIDVNEDKEDAMDFVLWKAKKPGEPSWPSPWGEGRPGWHIECSAMVNKFLGETIDIHCGGKDLIFPHHENEIAQSECANCKPFAHYWMHNGYINVDNRKMSKSLNNFFTVRDVVKDFSYEVIRFFMLSAHYRSPINFSRDLLEQAETGLKRIKTCLENLEFLMNSYTDGEITAEENTLLENLKTHRSRFIEAMDDDLNTADGISAVFELVREMNSVFVNGKQYSKAFASKALELAKELLDVLGFSVAKEDLLDEEIEKMIAERNDARKAKDFKRADEIRDTLKAKGIVLEDTPQGVKWRKAD